MFVRHIAPGFLWAILILVLCGMPGHQIPDFNFSALWQFDKIVHFLLFTMQVLLLSIGLKKQFYYKFLRANAVKTALVFGLIYSGVTEALQLLIFTSRYFDYFDLMANLAGCLAGTLVFRLLYGKQSR